MAKQKKWYLWLCRHGVASFILLTFSFLAFGKLSVDLIHLFSANAEYLLDNGWIGLLEGGLQQLLELILTACAAMLFYLLFKLCEQALLERLRHEQQ